MTKYNAKYLQIMHIIEQWSEAVAIATCEHAPDSIFNFNSNRFSVFQMNLSNTASDFACNKILT